VRINSYPGRSFAGTVSRKNPQVDNGSRMFPIEILIPNDEHLLPPGSFANAMIQTGNDEQVVFVPQSAIVTFAGENKVFTVNDGKAEQWKLVTGERQVGPILVNNKRESFVEVRSLFHQIEKPRDATDDTGAAEDPKVLKSVVITGNSKLTTGVAVTAAVVPVSQPALATSGGPQ
jgi:multidrug efflux pump subunit AcrA (membrane-fusion protein)